MTFRYYACTDDWCIPVEQDYLITWSLDPDSGTQFGREIDPRMLGEFPQLPQ